MQTLPKFGVSNIDALLVTHGHADAMLGMDDLRDLQASFKRGAVSEKTLRVKLQLYLMDTNGG